MGDSIQKYDYNAELAAKRRHLASLYADLITSPPEVFPSAPEHFRMRAEFRAWRSGGTYSYAMFDPEHPKQPIRVERFDIASKAINAAMPLLMQRINGSHALSAGLFIVKFLSTQSGEVLITLVYRREISEAWSTEATDVAAAIGCHLVARSKKRKTVLTRDYVTESFTVAGDIFRYRQYDNGFTQPNAGINQQMLNWATSGVDSCEQDLLELYCGNGNFTLPLATRFRKVLATEVSKQSLRTAQENIDLNAARNIALARLSAEEVAQALDGVRPFRRLAHIELDSYDFDTVFVDPPRAGLDDFTRTFVARFRRIIYISCNPETQHRDVASLRGTHAITRFALFDQFPRTSHIECGLVLEATDGR